VNPESAGWAAVSLAAGGREHDDLHMSATAPALPLDIRSRPGRRLRGLPRWGAALVLVAAAAYAGHELALDAGVWRLREAAEHRLDMMASSLDADLARFDYLPALLEMTPAVAALLDSPGDPQLRAAANRHLNGVNATVGAEMLYVLDRSGTSIAASDWDRPGTTIGQDLSFRPYVSDAVVHGRGHFYGVGITSGKPGYYRSYALGRGQGVRGVAAVKIDIEEVESAWRKLPGDVLLIDERGVVILATRTEWKYRPLVPLDATQRAEVLRTRPYGEAPLEPLRWTKLQPLAHNTEVMGLDGSALLASTRTLPRAAWRLVALDDLAPARAAARYAAVTASLAMSVLLLIAVTLWQRRRAVRQKLASQAALQAAHDSLESTVIARTAELRAAQSDLVHAGKMGVLGQMSARMVHELNQPLTALRTLSDSASVLLDHERIDDARVNLQRITGMVDRLARLTSRLKAFAHKSDLPAQPVPLLRSISDAHALLGADLKQHGIRVEIEVRPAELAVMADEATVSSVLVNLMRNAIDAMQDSPRRLLRVAARVEDECAIVTVADTGPGIRADILARLFEPFVSSKPAGSGLGLGLVISAQLVRAFGGTLRAINRDEGGASFVISLPSAPLAVAPGHG
jgi:two-component system C4-dicarboxylate transport sensor histidine kinase DctB